uniref:Uncharacterized protein n=1 Tax=Magallana gigas TaxID=29159 RepID=K1Q8W3_MAGGI
MRARTSLHKQGSNLATQAEHHSCAARTLASPIHADNSPNTRRAAMCCCQCQHCKAKTSPARHEPLEYINEQGAIN